MADDRVNVVFGAQVNELLRGVAEVKSSIEGLTAPVTNFVGNLRGIAEAAGIAFAVEKIRSWAEASAEAAEQTVVFAAALGISATKTAELQGVMRLLGGDAEGLLRGFSRLGHAATQALLDPNSSMAAAFRVAGLDAAKFRKQLIEDLPAAIDTLAAAWKRAEAAGGTGGIEGPFGAILSPRGFENFARLMKEGPEGIERMKQQWRELHGVSGEALQEQIDKEEKIARLQHGMEEAFRGLKDSVVEGLAEPLTKVLTTVTDITKHITTAFRTGTLGSDLTKIIKDIDWEGIGTYAGKKFVDGMVGIFRSDGGAAISEALRKNIEDVVKGFFQQLTDAIKGSDFATKPLFPGILPGPTEGPQPGGGYYAPIPQKESYEGPDVLKPRLGDPGVVRGSVFGNYGSRWVDKGDSGLQASGVPVSAGPGIALPSGSTLGQMFEVTTPDGRKFLLKQTDKGPSQDPSKTGGKLRGVDINAVAAEQMGYSPGNFPTDAPFKVEPASGTGGGSNLAQQYLDELQRKKRLDDQKKELEAKFQAEDAALKQSIQQNTNYNDKVNELEQKRVELSKKYQQERMAIEKQYPGGPEAGVALKGQAEITRIETDALRRSQSIAEEKAAIANKEIDIQIRGIERTGNEELKQVEVRRRYGEISITDAEHKETEILNATKRRIDEQLALEQKNAGDMKRIADRVRLEREAIDLAYEDKRKVIEDRANDQRLADAHSINQTIASDLSSSLVQVATGRTTILQAFSQLGENLGQKMIEKILEKFLSSSLFGAGGLGGLLGGVSEGGGFLSSIPLLGLLFAARGGIVPSAAGGWAIPSFQGGGLLAQLHSGEMVLPKDISQGMQSMIASGGPGNVSVNITAIDSQDVKRFFVNNGALLVSSMNKAMRNGSIVRAT